jgi:hypothetical protein
MSPRNSRCSPLTKILAISRQVSGSLSNYFLKGIGERLPWTTFKLEVKEFFAKKICDYS